MPALSDLPSIAGLTLPAGATNVKVKASAPDPTSQKVDVTTLSDDEKVYADPPLIDAGGGSNDGITETVSVSFFGTPPAVNTNPAATGWICTETEEEYAVGDFIKGTATYVYKAP